MPLEQLKLWWNSIENASIFNKLQLPLEVASAPLLFCTKKGNSVHAGASKSCYQAYCFTCKTKKAMTLFCLMIKHTSCRDQGLNYMSCILTACCNTWLVVNQLNRQLIGNYFENRLSHYSCKYISWFQLLKTFNN